MRLAVVAVLLVVAGCQPAADLSQERSTARLERELRQAQAANMQGLLETRSEMYEPTIKEIEARHEKLKQLLETLESMPADESAPAQ